MAEVIPMKLVPTVAGEATLSRFRPGDVQAIEHGGTGADDAVAALANLGGARSADLVAHQAASNPHGISAAMLGVVLQAVFDAHANNTAIHRQINDNGETLLDLWSALQIKNHVQAQIDALVASAPGALDTINELAAALGNDPNAITTLSNEIALKLPLSDRGASEGVCELIAGLIPLARLPFQQAVFGSQFKYAEDLLVDSNASEAWAEKLSLTTDVLPNGLYRLEAAYGWNHNSRTSDFMGRVLQDGITQLGEEHVQEPKDVAGTWSNTGTNQRHYIHRVFNLSLTGQHTFSLEYTTSNNGDESSIWEASLSFWRIGDAE